MIHVYMKLFPMLLIMALLTSVIPLHAEMKINLKSGKVIEIPVSRDEVDSIEYSSPENPDEGKVFAENSIRIQSAKYGNVSFELGNKLGYKQYFCDARPELMKRCDGRKKCKIIVGSNICGDPYPGHGKYLYVEYTCGEKLKRAKNSQTEVMHLKCP